MHNIIVCLFDITCTMYMHNANVGRHTECAVASFQYLRPCLIIQRVVLIFARIHVRYYMYAHEKSRAHIVQLLPPNISSCVLRSASFVLLSTRLTYWQNIYKKNRYKYFHYLVNFGIKSKNTSLPEIWWLRFYMDLAYWQIKPKWYLIIPFRTKISKQILLLYQIQ